MKLKLKMLSGTKLKALSFVILLILRAACSGGGSEDNNHATAVTMVTPPPLSSSAASAIEAPTPPEACGPTLDSVRRSIRFGDKACSPDKIMYAREEEPEQTGRIGLYERATERQLKVVKVTQHTEGESPNEIKGLAWSPDSRRLAVMYHQSGGGTVSIVDVGEGREVNRLSIKGQPHRIEFSTPNQVRAGDELLDVPE